MEFEDVIGWTGSIVSLVSFSMKTMVPLRVLACIASALFIWFGIITGIYHSVVLNSALFVFNAFRLYEILKVSRAVKTLKGEPSEFDWLRDIARPSEMTEGELIFRKGDAPDGLYYLDKGTVELSEIGVTLNAGTVFGEIAFFTDAGERTSSAVCREDCHVIHIDESTFIDLYYRNPAFSVSIVKLISKRLMEGRIKPPETLHPASQPVAP